jgi:nicotinamidase-related amidase
MNDDLGVWTDQDCALVLIDYQNEILATIRSETNADLVELNVRLLAKTAKAFNLPMAIERLSHAGAVPNTALAVLCEQFRDWTSPMANKAREVIAWYFAEVPKLTAEVGV